MAILHDIEQILARIETDIGHVVALRKQYIATEAEHIFSNADNKINGLKAWVMDIRQALRGKTGSR